MENKYIAFEIKSRSSKTFGLEGYMENRVSVLCISNSQGKKGSSAVLGSWTIFMFIKRGHRLIKNIV